MEKKADRMKPYYARNEEKRIILYDSLEINNEKYSAVDICFVCDTTGSMDKYIEPVRLILINFLDNVAKLINTKPRVAFVGYKDKLKDESNNVIPTPIEVRNFTTDYESMVEFITGIDCEGGSDTCEDVVEALKRALMLDWSSDLNYVYLIADAPPHGARYHLADVSDDFLEEDKDKPLEKLATHYRKSKINLAIIRCNNIVDIMIETISKYYNSRANKLRVIQINNEDLLKEDFTKHFLITLSKDIADLLAESRERDFKRIKRGTAELKEVEIDSEIKDGAQFSGVSYVGSISDIAFDNGKYNYNFSINKSEELKCKLAKQIVGTGLFSNCYHLQIKEDTSYVAKVPKILLTEPEEFRPEIEGTLLTDYFAKKFNKLLAKAESNAQNTEAATAARTMITVLPLKIIQGSLDPSIESKERRVFLAQSFLNGQYIKFNNNYGWRRQEQDKSTLLAQAFSHFTYEASMGYMMITDIQGIKKERDGIIITDPAIHSYVLKDHFGETNHGKIGMIRFFKTHDCNDYCKKLMLLNSKTIDKTKIESIKEKYKKEEDLNHLYKDFTINLDAWKKRIQSFDPKLDPDVAPVEIEEEDFVSRLIN